MCPGSVPARTRQHRGTMTTGSSSTGARTPCATHERILAVGGGRWPGRDVSLQRQSPSRPGWVFTVYRHFPPRPLPHPGGLPPARVCAIVAVVTAPARGARPGPGFRIWTNRPLARYMMTNEAWPTPCAPRRHPNASCPRTRTKRWSARSPTRCWRRTCGPAPCGPCSNPETVLARAQRPECPRPDGDWLSRPMSLTYLIAGHALRTTAVRVGLEVSKGGPASSNGL